MTTPTIPELLDLRAHESSDKPLLQVLDQVRTAEELRAGAYSFGAMLREHGVQTGDRVAVMADNRMELVEIWLGCTTIGAIFVPINVSIRGLQLAHVIADAAPTTLIAELALFPHLREAGLPKSVRQMWTLSGDHLDPDLSVLPRVANDAEVFAATGRASDCCALLYTSGTTGPSKGVECSHAQLIWFARNTAAALEITSSDVLYTCLPLFHVNALNTVLQGLDSGATVVIGPKFSASRFWGVVSECGATVTYLLGAMVSILVSRSSSEYVQDHRLRIALAPATPPLAWKIFEERFGISIVEGHGMTETNLVIGPRDGQQRPGWMGRTMPGFEARVVDEHGNQVPDGTPGELVVRADDRDMFAIGYWHLPEASATAWRDGWFLTGDRVERDGEGYFRFLDRVKDAIRRRGENISAWEVEKVLEEHPAVANAAVVPVPSQLGEDDVMAFVVPASGAFVDPPEVVRYCDGRLAYFAVPRYIEVVDALPVTETGKVRKVVLREAGISESTWDRERHGIDQ